MRARQLMGMIAKVSLPALFLPAPGVSSTPAPIGIQVGTFGGTTGFGFEGAIRVNRFCQVRAGRSSLELGLGSTYRGIPYRYDSDMTWTSALLDLFPGDGGFHFTAGAFMNDASVEMTAVSDDPLGIGSRSYTPDQLGEIRGTVSLLPAAPYIGMGFGSLPAAEPGLHMSMDLGVVFQDYTVDLWREGGALPPEIEQQLSEDVEVEQTLLEEQFDRFGVYPVVSFSLSCRF